VGGDVIALLNKDLEGEHAAIIQYLTHAYSMGEGEMACEIEAIAREEMRHLDWLAETVVSLGGVPRLTRGMMRTSGPSVADWMRNNVLQEQDTITTTGSPKRPRIQTSESSSSGYGTMNYTMLTFSAIC